MDAPAAPDDATRERLLAMLAELVASGGAGPLLAAPIAPAGAAFPERWRPTRTGVTLLLRRLAWHAGLDRAIVLAGEPLGAPPTERRPATRVELVRVGERELVFDYGFVGRDDVAGTLAHEIGVAYAVMHRRDDGPYRGTVPSDDDASPGGIPVDEHDLARGSVAAVYLGLGVLAANAAFQQYSGSGRTNGAYIPLEYDVLRAGHLAMSELAFLLAVQAVVRGDDRPPPDLSPPQRDEVLAAIDSIRTSIRSSVHPREALRARLGIAADAVPRERDAVIAFDDPGEPDLAQRTGFRWRTHRAGTGFLVGSVLGVAIAATSPVRGLVPVCAALASAVGGFAAGRRVRIARCSRCLALVQPGRNACPRCDAALRGDIAHLSDRLAAEEALDGQPTRELDALDE